MHFQSIVGVVHGFCLRYYIIVVFVASIVLKNPEVTEDEGERNNKSFLWKTKELYIIAWMYFIVGVVYLIPNLYQTSFMINNGISASISGTVYAIAGMFSIVGAPVWGLISDRVGIKKTLCIALLLAVIGDMIPIIFGHTLALSCRQLFGVPASEVSFY